ncbi:TetR/AcrR family transcriptional regulator [Streptomyces armeniacus]|uniref:TetR/AcrR family transcriptional regulator n=1 Tax=Streptomyces armeniacus TaxID=83291 RepID=A0A345XX32_9ACTN|nr:TetR/AcrR family transcriptional regulator [Streptomyces armeniacus]AXK36198.1 TetR/AcrR family transcriptional regulator [Streptomyces armeniacus]
MGHREDLLEGAKRCLLAKGYARTTARDIVRESGTNLASIGYHYGSKDALLREALFAAMGEWADDVQQALEAGIDPGAPLAERFEAGWATVGALFEKHQRVWSSNLEAVLHADTDPELRAAFVRAQPEARVGLVSLFNGVPEAHVSDEEAGVFGTLYQTLVAGLIVQKALDPDFVLSGHDLLVAMRRIVGDAGDMGTTADAGEARS